MIPENRLLFACTRQDFLDEHQKAVLDLRGNTEIRWDEVCSTAQLHGVAPLVYSNLLQCDAVDIGVPHQIMDRFRLSYYHNIAVKERRAARIPEVLSFFNERQIDVMLVKGAALDLLVYDHAWYTISDDMDLVMRPRRQDIPDEDNAEIVQFLHRTGVEYDYFEHHDIVLNSVLPIDFQRIWSDAIKMELEGLPVFVMSPEDMLISACTNSCRKRFFRLKCLCDIAEIINKHSDLEWEEVTRRAREDHCNSIVYAALFATRMTLGCKLPDGVLDDLTVDPAKAAVIRYLADYVSRCSSLSSLYPRSGRKRPNRKVNAPLFLAYVTLRPYQVWRKIKRLYGELQN